MDPDEALDLLAAELHMDFSDYRDEAVSVVRAEIGRLRSLLEQAADLFDAHFLPQTAALFRRELEPPEDGTDD